jgi:hypothetical protein
VVILWGIGGWVVGPLLASIFHHHHQQQQQQQLVSMVINRHNSQVDRGR